MNILRYVGSAGLAAMAACASPGAPDAAADYRPFGSLQVASDYLGSRGFLIEEGPVVQGSVGIAHTVLDGDDVRQDGPWASIWGNYNTHKDELSEVDLNAGYKGRLDDDLAYGLTGSVYVFNDFGLEPALDLDVSLSALTLPLQPTVNLIYNRNEVSSGTYVGLSGSHTFATDPPVTVRGVLGYNDHHFTHDSGLSHAVLGLSFPLCGRATFAIDWQEALRDDFRDRTVMRVSTRF